MKVTPGLGSLSFAILALSLMAGDAPAQARFLPASLSPDLNELNAAMPCPLMCPSARLQQFFAASEVGLTPAVFSRVTFRFDGPTAATQLRGFTIQQLTLKIGGTTVPITGLGA